MEHSKSVIVKAVYIHEKFGNSTATYNGTGRSDHRCSMLHSCSLDYRGSQATCDSN